MHDIRRRRAAMAVRGMGLGHSQSGNQLWPFALFRGHIFQGTDREGEPDWHAIKIRCVQANHAGAGSVCVDRHDNTSEPLGHQISDEIRHENVDQKS